MCRISLLVWMLLVSCSDAPAPESRPTEPAEPSAPSPAELEPVVEPAWRSADPVDLVGKIPLGIRVSSTTPSGRRGPCLMGDGNLESAWNSAAGDDHAWIRLGLPTTSIIRAFEMTPGYATPELFRANRRIKSVSVFHNGEFLRRFELDVESPALQRFEFDTPLEDGGSIEIRVDAFEAGSRTSWTEICVSELRLWGVAQTMSVADPICTVGEPGEGVEPELARFHRLHQEAKHSWAPGDALQRSALLSAIELVAGCSHPAYLRRRLSEVLRLEPDEDGQLPLAYSVFFGEMLEALQACGLEELRAPVHDLVNLRDDYDPD